VFGAAEFDRNRIGSLLIEVGNHDPGALTGKKHCNILADAAGRSGDNGNFIFKSHAVLQIYRK
jgi:hypothetical protein